MSKARFPTTRYGWFKYYVARFNKTGKPAAEQMALWYWLLYLEFEEEFA